MKFIAKMPKLFLHFKWCLVLEERNKKKRIAYSNKATLMIEIHFISDVVNCFILFLFETVASLIVRLLSFLCEINL